MRIQRDEQDPKRLMDADVPEQDDERSRGGQA